MEKLEKSYHSVGNVAHCLPKRTKCAQNPIQWSKFYPWTLQVKLKFTKLFAVNLCRNLKRNTYHTALETWHQSQSSSCTLPFAADTHSDSPDRPCRRRAANHANRRMSHISQDRHTLLSVRLAMYGTGHQNGTVCPNTGLVHQMGTCNSFEQSLLLKMLCIRWMEWQTWWVSKLVSKLEKKSSFYCFHSFFCRLLLKCSSLFEEFLFEFLK